MPEMLDWLEDSGFIVQYSVEGKDYIQIINFAKHQNPHKNETASVIPPISEADRTGVGRTDEAVPIKSEGGPKSDEAIGLIPDSLIPDSKDTPSTAKAADSSAVQLKTFLARCKAESVKPVPENDPVFEWADDAGIPPDFLWLAWREFVARYLEEPKKYKDWRMVFRKAVRGNWLRLWYADSATGEYRLTTAGVQAERVHKEAA